MTRRPPARLTDNGGSGDGHGTPVSDTIGRVETGGGRRAADRLLVQTGRRGGASVVVLAITTLAVAGAETLFPAALGRAVDGALRGGGAGSWLLWCGLLVAVLVACDALDDLA